MTDFKIEFWQSLAHFKTEEMFGVHRKISKHLKEVERYM
jgi:hypothetical protein